MRTLFTALVGLASTLPSFGQDTRPPAPPGFIPIETRLKDAPKSEDYQIPKVAEAREGTLRDGKRCIGYYLVVPPDKPLREGDDPVMTDILVGARHFLGKQLVFETRYLANSRTRTSSKHGFERTWHPNGLIQSELLYDQGLLNGACKQWSDNGKLLGTYEMKLGKGTRKEWSDDGNLLRETPLVNNKEDGRQITYSRGGQMLEEMHYKAGEFHGINRRWRSDGSLFPGYPLYFLDGKEVTREQYEDRARKRDQSAPIR